jgi:hypothetical protein
LVKIYRFFLNLKKFACQDSHHIIDLGQSIFKDHKLLSIEAGLSTARFVVPKNPFLGWIPMQINNRIRFDNLRGDIFGGVTATIVSLSLALAFGVASGAGAIAGLYGAVCVGFFAALLGGTPTLISEPTGPMTVVMTKVGIDILDWSFLKSAHKIALKRTLIMYG